MSLRFFQLALKVKCRWILLELNSWRPHPSLGRGRIILPVFTSSIKRLIRKFHVVVVQWRQRNVQKSVLHVQGPNAPPRCSNWSIVRFKTKSSNSYKGKPLFSLRALFAKETSLNFYAWRVPLEKSKEVPLFCGNLVFIPRKTSLNEVKDFRFPFRQLMK